MGNTKTSASSHEDNSAHSFDEFFRQPEQGRSAFLSRLFGLFNEDVVKCWCQCPQATYASLGRPTLREVAAPNTFTTLDFTLQHSKTKQTFVAEMKCELQFENYRYLRLTNAQQLEHHSKARSVAFRWFLRSASAPKVFDVRVDGKPVPVDGAILIWGAITPQGRDEVMKGHGIADVLSIEDMLCDLREWQPTEWLERVSRLRRWSNELFDFLS